MLVFDYRFIVWFIRFIFLFENAKNKWSVRKDLAHFDYNVLMNRREPQNFTVINLVAK